ncbi:hypothetical protein ABEB36_001073 [Hypothenemus hampei]|uniref:F5/8 type C domain-containing protein n=1 Tax=Hypothenemus hampei TaxID=57062 RepID=A0ABD1FDC8_HYPHA
MQYTPPDLKSKWKKFMATECTDKRLAAQRLVISAALEATLCIAPLGMENGLIKDADIKASSSYDYGNVGPQHARIRNELNGGAWCPHNQATSEATEWLEINLHTVHMITAAEVQGRFGNGQGVEFAESYILEYFRPRLNKWVRYRTKSNHHLLKGNINTYLEEKTVLNTPIWASKIRFHPYSSYKRTVCLRVEIYGCPWPDGILSYAMPQGDKRSSTWEFYDFSYDGHWDGNSLKNGLGQLVDGQIAPDDFKVPFQEEENLQGWVGWKNDTRNYIELIFEFDRVREFRLLHLFVNNQFTKEVQVFSVVKVFFSPDGKNYQKDPEIYQYTPDKIFENARNVSVKLHHRVGQFVKLQLHFAAKWLLLSEISFESSVVLNDFPYIEEELTTQTSLINKKSPKAENNGLYLGVAIAMLVVLMFSITLIVMYVILQQKKYKNLQRSTQVNKDLYGIQSLDLINVDYSERQESEYAVPLQMGYTCPDDTLHKPFEEEQYYAAVDVCKPDFIPPPPPPCSPRPPRLQNPPQFLMHKVYVGP